MSLSHEKKLEARCIEHCSPQAIYDLLQSDSEAALERLKKAGGLEQFKTAQGEIKVLDRYIEVLEKVLGITK